MGKSMSSAGRANGEDHQRQEMTAANIRSLPSEILPLIFAHLPAEDCKNVRLACRTWKQHSYARVVMQKQKFVFKYTDNIAEIVKFLLRSTHIHLLNLEFKDLCVNALTASVWIKCGPQVHSLYFIGCESGRTALANISLHCVNLTSLEMIDMDDCRNGCGARDHSDADSLFNLTDLVRNGVKRTKLRNFVWFHHNCHLPAATVKQFFLVFPCLTRFGMGPEPSYDYQLHATDERNATRMYANFDECLNSSMPLERIVYNRATDGSWMTRSILKPEWSSRLIELQTLLRYENLPDFGRKLLFGLFAAQKNLRIVTLNELDGDEVVIKDLMFWIFEHCPNLRELQLRFKNVDETGASLPMRSVTFTTYMEFARFFSYLTELKCFVVNFDIKLGFPNDLLADLPSTSFAMARLHLNQSRSSKQFCLSVLQRCSKLVYLEASIVFDDLLQEIFKNINLKKLQLVTYLYHDPGVGTLTDYGFTGRSGSGEHQQQGLSIKCLRKLEHLKLRIQDRFDVSPTGWQKRGILFTRHSGVTVKSIRELQFPRLKSLDLFLELDSQLDLCGRLDPDESPESPSTEWCCGVKPITELPSSILIDLATNLPAIRSLKISPFPRDFATLLKMCKMSKHLSLLQCSQMPRFDVDRLFGTSPHLMSLELYEEGDPCRAQFRRHPMTKEIQSRVIQYVVP